MFGETGPSTGLPDVYEGLKFRSRRRDRDEGQPLTFVEKVLDGKQKAVADLGLSLGYSSDFLPFKVDGVDGRLHMPYFITNARREESHSADRTLLMLRQDWTPHDLASVLNNRFVPHEPLRKEWGRTCSQTGHLTSSDQPELNKSRPISVIWNEGLEHSAILTLLEDQHTSEGGKSASDSVIGPMFFGFEKLPTVGTDGRWSASAVVIMLKRGIWCDATDDGRDIERRTFAECLADQQTGAE